MLHAPARREKKDHATPYKMRLGVLMFVVYAIIYGGFVAINVIKPVLMETRMIFGLNLAVVYGVGLIISALVLALIYNHLCAKKEFGRRAMDSEGEGN